jgi:hypothetical protein
MEIHLNILSLPISLLGVPIVTRNASITLGGFYEP